MAFDRILIAIFVLALAQVGNCAEYTRSNDEQTLRTLIDAVTTNQARTRSGCLVANVVHQNHPALKGIPPQVVNGRETAHFAEYRDLVELEWHNGRVFGKVISHAYEDHSDSQFTSERQLEIIRNEQVEGTLVFRKGSASKRLAIDLPKAKSFMFESHRIDPDSFWYKSLFSRYSHIEVLTQRGFNKAPSSVQVTRVSEHLVRVQYDFVADGRPGRAMYWLNVDFSQGGNVTERGEEGPAQGRSICRYSWQEGPDGVWYLHSYDHRFTKPGEQEPWQTVSLDTVSFELCPKSPGSRFDLDSLLKHENVGSIIDYRSGVPMIRRPQSEAASKDTPCGDDAAEDRRGDGPKYQ